MRLLRPLASIANALTAADVLDLWKVSIVVEVVDGDGGGHVDGVE